MAQTRTMESRTGRTNQREPYSNFFLIFIYFSFVSFFCFFCREPLDGARAVFIQRPAFIFKRRTPAHTLSHTHIPLPPQPCNAPEDTQKEKGPVRSCDLQILCRQKYPQHTHAHTLLAFDLIFFMHIKSYSTIQHPSSSLCPSFPLPPFHHAAAPFS